MSEMREARALDGVEDVRRTSQRGARLVVSALLEDVVRDRAGESVRQGSGLVTEEERVMESIRIDLKWAGEMEEPPPWLVEDRLRKYACPRCAYSAVQSLSHDRPVMRVDCSICGVRYFHMGTYKEIILDNPFNEEIEI